LPAKYTVRLSSLATTPLPLIDPAPRGSTPWSIVMPPGALARRAAVGALEREHRSAARG